VQSDVSPFGANSGNLQLPEFSSHVKVCLRSGDSRKVWHKMIEEMAFFYMDVAPTDISSQTQYLEIGKRMVQMYPSVKREGTKPWVSNNNIYSL